MRAYVIETGGGKDRYDRLLDITGRRLQEMDENHIRVQVLSFTAAGLQNLKAATKQEQIEKATAVNDYLYGKIRMYPKRFRAFCALPMRDPTAAALELERSVKQLGMVGALVNGSDILPEENRVLYYDTPDYDVLWKKFEELDVPLYIHPTVFPSMGDSVSDKELQNFYKDYPQLPGSAWGFSVYLGQQILRLVLSGVFDRFPRLKIILGHMGEVLPWWAERFDHRLCIDKNELEQITPLNFCGKNSPSFHSQNYPSPRTCVAIST